MRILFISPYPHEVAPSQRFRYEQYLHALDEQGIEYDIAPFISEETWKILHTPGMFQAKAWGILGGFRRRLAQCFKLNKYDYVFIHREASHVGPPIFEWMIAKVFRKKFIYDFDDAIWLPNYSSHNAKFHKLKQYEKVHKIMKWAHKISAGNQYLGDYAAQFNDSQRIVQLPTTIDTENYHNQIKKHHENKLIIGWTGTLTTSKYVQFILPILRKLEQRYQFEFCMISNEDPEYDLKSFKFKRWKKESEIEDLLHFDIGIMPLEEDQWSKGKCGFKALQYMALGIPPIVSPVGVNTDIVQHNVNGLVCNTAEEWERAFERLMVYPELRERLGKEARKTIEQQYSVKANTEKFLKLFEG